MRRNLGTDFGFTGEMTDANELLFLRARYYAPESSVFTALDPFEGAIQRPMSLNGYLYVDGDPVNGAVGELLGLLNGYSYANGNPVNLTDANGMCAKRTTDTDASNEGSGDILTDT